MLFLFHKFTGTDSLNYYAPAIFKLIGVNGNSNTLLTTVCNIELRNYTVVANSASQGVYGIVKFVTTIFYVAFLVE